MSKPTFHRARNAGYVFASLQGKWMPAFAGMTSFAF